MVFVRDCCCSGQIVQQLCWTPCHSPWGEPAKSHRHTETPSHSRSKLPAHPQCCPTGLSGNTCFPMGITATMRPKHILNRINLAYMLLFFPGDSNSPVSCGRLARQACRIQPCLVRVPRQQKKHSTGTSLEQRLLLFF